MRHQVCKLFYEGGPHEIDFPNCTEIDEKSMKELCNQSATSRYGRA